MQRRGSPKRAQSRVRMHNADWTEALARGAEEAIGHRFSDRALLKTCFTHASLTNETGEPSNERLEFLGVAVLELCVTEQLYCSSAEDEGALTERRLARKKEKFEMKEGVKALAVFDVIDRETEEAAEGVEGGQDNA